MIFNEQRGMRWRTMLAAAVFLGGTSAWAQVIQVPQQCIVVDVGNAGALGVTGAGGKVGDGGIITMSATPTDQNFTFVPNGPQTVKYWHLLGDLSFVGTTPVRAITGSVNTVNISSYNYHPPSERPWENPGNGARSKGRIIVKYSTASACPGDQDCSTWMNIDVYKTFPGTWFGDIVGPKCIVPGNTVTYSVKPILSDNAEDMIGFDQYYWTLLNGEGQNLITSESALVWYSGDRSSITLSWTGAFAGWYANGTKPPYKLYCSFGRANHGWDRGTGISPVCVNPTPPGQTCGTIFSNFLDLGIGAVNPLQASVMCLPYTTSTHTIGFTPIPGNTYRWWCTQDWQVTAGPNSVTLDGMTGPSAVLWVEVRTPCGGFAEYSIAIDRSMGDVDPLRPTCVAAGAPFSMGFPQPGLPVEDLVFRVSTNASPSVSLNTDWSATYNGASVPPSWSFTPPAGTCAGSYIVRPAIKPEVASWTSCGSPSPTVIVKPATPVITGPDCVEANGIAPVQYTSSTPCGTSQYIWSNDMGMTPGPTNPPSPNAFVDLVPAGTGTGYVGVVARFSLNGVTCDSDMGTIDVKRGPSPPVLDALPCVVSGSSGTATFSVQPHVNYGYSWQFQSGFAQQTTAQGSSVTVNTLGVPGTYTFSVTTVSGDGCEATTSGSVIVWDFSVTSVDESDPDQTRISVPSVPGYIYQLYDCDDNASVGDPQTGDGTFWLTSDQNGNGSYAIQITPLCGPLITSPCATTSHTKSARRVPGEDRPFHVMPNPNDGSFTVDVPDAFGTGYMQLLDDGGKQIGGRRMLVQGKNQVRYDGLAPGVYHVRIELNGQVRTERIVITRR